MRYDQHEDQWRLAETTSAIEVAEIEDDEPSAGDTGLQVDDEDQEDAEDEDEEDEDEEDEDEEDEENEDEDEEDEDDDDDDDDDEAVEDEDAGIETAR